MERNQTRKLPYCLIFFKAIKEENPVRANKNDYCKQGPPPFLSFLAFYSAAAIWQDLCQTSVLMHPLLFFFHRATPTCAIMSVMQVPLSWPIPLS